MLFGHFEVASNGASKCAYRLNSLDFVPKVVTGIRYRNRPFGLPKIAPILTEGCCAKPERMTNGAAISAVDPPTIARLLVETPAIVILLCPDMLSFLTSNRDSIFRYD